MERPASRWDERGHELNRVVTASPFRPTVELRIIRCVTERSRNRRRNGLVLPGPGSGRGSREGDEEDGYGRRIKTTRRTKHERDRPQLPPNRHTHAPHNPRLAFIVRPTEASAASPHTAGNRGAGAWHRVLNTSTGMFLMRGLDNVTCLRTPRDTPWRLWLVFRPWDSRCLRGLAPVRNRFFVFARFTWATFFLCRVSRGDLDTVFQTMRIWGLIFLNSLNFNLNRLCRIIELN